MESVVVLIAAPGSGAIGSTIISALRDLGATEPRWLAPQEALEVEDFGRAVELASALEGLPIDMNVVPATGRRKRLLIADMDSTMIEQECIDELGEMAGAGARIREITTRSMRGEIDFVGAVRERVALLKGLEERVIEEILRERIVLARGGSTLVATMKAQGAHAALISGGFRQFTADVASRLGFDEHSANVLKISAGHLTGEVEEPVLGQDAKVAALRRITAKLGVTPAEAIAVGDGANDLPMLLEAGLGVALHAKPHVRAAARIAVNHGDLTALLYLQGFSRGEFVNN
jgi:phosphoserine phosphatase